MRPLSGIRRSASPTCKTCAARLPSGLTSLIQTPYYDRVIRLFIAALCAFALAFSPAVASGAFADPAGKPGCAMNGQMPAKPVDHSKIDCCAPACQISAGALLPNRIADEAPLESNGALHDRAAVKELASITVTGLDPPPRTISS